MDESCIASGKTRKPETTLHLASIFSFLLPQISIQCINIIDSDFGRIKSCLPTKDKDFQTEPLGLLNPIPKPNSQLQILSKKKPDFLMGTNDL